VKNIGLHRFVKLVKAGRLDAKSGRGSKTIVNRVEAFFPQLNSRYGAARFGIPEKEAMRLPLLFKREIGSLFPVVIGELATDADRF
jgi:hypothetical protein